MSEKDTNGGELPPVSRIVVPAGWRTFRLEDLPQGWRDAMPTTPELDVVVDRLTPLVEEVGQAEEEHDLAVILKRIEELLAR